MERDARRGFGALIRARRRQLNLTQEELARRVQTSIPYIGHLETERRCPSEKIMTRLADTLGLDTRELFFLANPTAKRLVSQHRESEGASAWESLCEDEAFRKIHNITENEMRALSAVSLLGEIRTMRDFVFILNAIRQALS